MGVFLFFFVFFCFLGFMCLVLRVLPMPPRLSPESSSGFRTSSSGSREACACHRPQTQVGDLPERLPR